MALFGFGNSKKTETQTTNETMMPNVPEWLRAPTAEYVNQWRHMIGETENPASYTIGANANQAGAFQGAQRLGSNLGMQGGQGLTAELANASLMSGMPSMWQGQGMMSRLANAPLNSGGASQQQGQGLTSQLANASLMSGMPYMWQAGEGLQQLGNYNAPKTTMPQNWRASLTAPTGNYNANTLAGTDLSPYQNPYQQQVIDASMGDYNNLLAEGMNSIKANTPQGAYGGSRQGVAMGQFAADAARNQASQLAGLRQSGFLNAQGMGQFDVGNRNQFQGQQNADLFSANSQNAAARNNMLLQRNNADMATQQFNSGQDLASAGLRRGVFGDLAGLGANINAQELQQANFRRGIAGDLFSQGSQLNSEDLGRAGFQSGIASNLFNQGRGINADELQKANFQRGIAGDLFSQGTAANADQRANLSLLQQTGDSQRDIDLANNPLLARLQYLNSLGGMLGYSNADLFTGQTTTGTGTITSKGGGGGLGGLLGGVGSLFSGIGALR